MVDTPELAARAEILQRFHKNRVLAHRTLFPHRHKVASPDFHIEIINAIHGPHPRELIKAFRGAAKSTLAEEGMLIRAGFEEFTYGIIIGNTHPKALQRLAAIKREVDNNKALLSAFGDLRGAIWNENKITFSNGCVIQAFSRGQTVRGIKEDNRPDFCLVDDLEDEESTRDADAISETMDWLLTELVPALEDFNKTPIRLLGTPLDPNCVVNQLERDPDWNARVFPIRYEDQAGVMRAMWPAKFSLDEIEKMEQTATRLHKHKSFAQEYLLQSESESERVFKEEYFRYEPQVRTWEATFIVVDPARTTNASSATTGYVAYSWRGARLVVWRAYGEFHKPDEILDQMFALDEEFHPVFVAVEEDGLNEWLLQPIRRRQLEVGRVLPLRAVKAPRGKLPFIGGLQPYFVAKDVIFSGDRIAFANATAQFMSFPKGRIDVPNALAYALRLRAGEPVYPDFTMACIYAEGELAVLRGQPLYLALNADGGQVTGVLAQNHLGTTRVIMDWAIEGTAEDKLRQIVAAAQMAGGGPVKLVAAPSHFDRFHNFGLVQAANRIPLEVTAGTAPTVGRSEITRALQTQVRGEPGLLIAADARWTLNGLSAGYARRVVGGNILAPEPEPGVYKTLMEGLESFAGLAWVGQQDQMRPDGNYRTGTDGKPYLSIMRSSR
jgi:hypothetical protein